PSAHPPTGWRCGCGPASASPRTDPPRPDGAQRVVPGTQMLPSPSLGPPWLSLSRSPAFAPWGIPEELELPALELELDDAAGADEELEDFDEDEPPPQPASARAPATSRSPIQRRPDVTLMVMVFTST